MTVIPTWCCMHEGPLTSVLFNSRDLGDDYVHRKGPSLIRVAETHQRLDKILGFI